MGGTDYQLQLTDEARREHLHALFGHRFTMQGKLQLPELTHYNQIGTSKGLQSLATEMCRWIGLKPNGLEVNYSPGRIPSGYSVDIKSKQVRIEDTYAKHPYSCAAILTFALLCYAITKAGHSEPDQNFIEFAAIELGLGLWIINALSPNLPVHHKIYHIIDTSWHQRETLPLQSYSPAQFANSVIKYAHENRIAADEYLPHILKRNQQLVPQFVRTQTTRHLPEASITRQHRKAARLFWIKIVVSSAVIASAFVLTFYLIASEEKTINPEARKQLQLIESLRSQHAKCQQQASELQSSYDPNDLFMTRQVDAIKARCESLRNQYNYAIDQYQSKY